MKAARIAAVELRRWSRDRSNIFFVFILPIGIIVLVGSLSGAGATPVVGLVASGDVGDELAELLEEPFTVVHVDDADDLVLRVERGSLQAGVVVPVDYRESLLAGETVELGFVARPGTLLEPAVQAAAVEAASVLRAAAFAASTTAADPDDLVGLAGKVAAEVPRIEVAARTAGEALIPATTGQFDLAASSNLVLFMFLTGLTGSVALIGTRRLGVARRMLSTPTSAGTIIVGEALARLGITLVQGMYIVAVSAALFGVDWGDPAAAAAIVLLFGAVSAGTAMLMGAVFANEQQAGGVGVMAGIGVAALGGAMVPLEFYSPTMRTVAHMTPHAWAIDAFAELVRHGAGIVDIASELGVLAAFAGVLLAVASVSLRVSLTR